MVSKKLLLLVGIVSIAAFLRFWHLDSVPPGVFRDEAINATQGWTAAQGGNFGFKIFYPENNGREGLWINVVGLTEHVFGPNEFSLRFCSGIVGTFTVLGILLLAHELVLSDSIAFLSAFFVATSFWHLNFSRICFSAIMVPMFTTWGLWFLLRAWRASSQSSPPGLNRFRLIPYALFNAVAGGMLFGFGFYSYIAYRLAPLIALIFCAVFWFRYAESRKQFLALAGLWFVTTFATALPIAIYFLHSPYEFWSRAREISVFSD